MGTMSWGSINKISRRSQGQSMECVAAGQPGASPGKVDNRASPQTPFRVPRSLSLGL